MLGMGKGMLYEELIADALYKRGGKLFYYFKVFLNQMEVGSDL